MDLVILFDWFTNESMDAALQATEWQQREMFLSLALMWGTAAQPAAKKHRPRRRLTQHRVDRGPRHGWLSGLLKTASALRPPLGLNVRAPRRDVVGFLNLGRARPTAILKSRA